jgi:uncharacterized membrane protein
VPDIHPFVVHFPVALLPASTCFELLAAFLKKPDLSRAGWWTQLLGVVGVTAAVISGLGAGERSGAAGEALERLTLHSQTAFLAAAFWAGLLLWRMGRRTEIPRPTTLYLLLMVAATLLILEVGLLGGELVFLYRLGIRP